MNQICRNSRNPEIERMLCLDFDKIEVKTLTEYMQKLPEICLSDIHREINGRIRLFYALIWTAYISILIIAILGLELPESGKRGILAGLVFVIYSCALFVKYKLLREKFRLAIFTLIASVESEWKFIFDWVYSIMTINSFPYTSVRGSKLIRNTALFAQLLHYIEQIVHSSTLNKHSGFVKLVQQLQPLFACKMPPDVLELANGIIKSIDELGIDTANWMSTKN